MTWSNGMQQNVQKRSRHDGRWNRWSGRRKGCVNKYAYDNRNVEWLKSSDSLDISSSQHAPVAKMGRQQCGGVDLFCCYKLDDMWAIATHPSLQPQLLHTIPQYHGKPRPHVPCQENPPFLPVSASDSGEMSQHTVQTDSLCPAVSVESATHEKRSGERHRYIQHVVRLGGNYSEWKESFVKSFDISFIFNFRFPTSLGMLALYFWWPSYFDLDHSRTVELSYVLIFQNWLEIYWLLMKYINESWSVEHL